MPTYISDSEVFGSPNYVSDDEVFGVGKSAYRPSQDSQSASVDYDEQKRKEAINKTARSLAVPDSVVEGAIERAKNRVQDWVIANPDKRDKANDLFAQHLDQFIQDDAERYKLDHKGVRDTLRDISVGDVGHAFVSGAHGLARGVNELIGNKYDAELLGKVEREHQAKLSDALRNEYNFSGNVAKTTLESIPMMAGGMAPGSMVAGGVRAAGARALGAGALADTAVPNTVAGLGRSIIGDALVKAAPAIGGGVGEGSMSALSGASQAADEFDAAVKKDRNAVLETPRGAELLASNNGDEVAALEQLRNEAIRKGAAYQGLATAVTGAMIPGVDAKIINSTLGRGERTVAGKATDIGGTILREPLQEFVQSGAEKMAGNLAAKQTFNPSQDVTEGALQDASMGAWSGALTAGAVESVYGASHLREKLSEIKLGELLTAKTGDEALVKFQESVPPLEVKVDGSAPNLPPIDTASLRADGGTPGASVESGVDVGTGVGTNEAGSVGNVLDQSSELPGGVSQAAVDPIKRTSDADLLSRIPTDVQNATQDANTQAEQAQTQATEGVGSNASTAVVPGTGATPVQTDGVTYHTETQKSTNPDLPYDYTVQDTGRVIIHGSPKEIAAALPGARVMPVTGGVVVGKSRAAEVVAKLGGQYEVASTQNVQDTPIAGDANGQQTVRVFNTGLDGNAGAATPSHATKAISAGVSGVAVSTAKPLVANVAPSVGNSFAAKARSDAQIELDDWHQKDPLNNPKVLLGDPSPDAESQIAHASELTKELLGKTATVVAFRDESPDSVNGFVSPTTGIVYINTKGLTSNTLNTGWHETHHVMQAIAEDDTRKGLVDTPAQRYISKVDAIFDTMGEAGKLNYIANFLYANAIDASPRVEAFVQSISQPIKYWSLAQKEQLQAIKMSEARRYLGRQKTRNEMMADFVGNRATDRGFIRAIAKADPQNFAQWAKQWLQTINDLLADLRGNKGNKESKAVDRYVADLKKSKMILMDAMIELKRTGVIPASTQIAPQAKQGATFQLRQDVSGGRRRVPVEEFDSAPDTTDELGAFNLDRKNAEMNSQDVDLENLFEKKISAEEQAELEKEANAAINPTGDPKQVTVEQMKAHGLFPEKAFKFGDPIVKPNAIVIDAHGDFGNGSIRLKSPDQYSVTAGSDWFNNSPGFTKDVAIALFKAHSSRPFVIQSGFDISSAYKKGTLLKVANAWKQMAQKANTFKVSKTSTSKDFAQVAKDMDAFNGYELTVSQRGGRDAYINLNFKDTATGATYNAFTHRPGYDYDEGDGFAINTMGLKGSRVGSTVYAVVAQWAKNRNEVFYCDDYISDVNTFRRTEQAFSFAIKSGDSGTLLPGLQNRVYGYEENPVSEQDHLMNIARLALANMRNLMEVMPDTTLPENGSHKIKYTPSTGKWTDENGNQTMIGLTRLKFFPETGVFLDQSGRDVTKGIQRWIADPKNRGTGIGASTVARAVITNNIIMGKLDVDSFDAFHEPVAYQRKQIDPLKVEDAEGTAEKSRKERVDFKAKAERMRDFHAKRDSILERINQDAKAGKEEAIVLRLIAKTGFRIGGGITEGKPTYAATTLKPEHVRISGRIMYFDFVGKAGVRQIHTVVNKDIADDLKTRMDREKLFNTTDRAVRRYKDSIPEMKNFKVHDFRTFVATDAAQKVVDALPQPENLAEYKGGLELALSEAAVKIGDTLETTKAHYVDPQIFDKWRESAGITDESEVQVGSGESQDDLPQADNGRGDEGEDGQAVQEVKYQRKQSPAGFYSALAEGVDSLNYKQLPAAAWTDALKSLVNKGKVKQDEIEWSGINDWLKLQGGKVTKEQVQEFLSNNGVQVQEVVLGNSRGFTQEMQERLDELEQNHDRTEAEDAEFQRLIRLENDASDDRGNTNQTKYSQYTLPGGKNYREVLLTLPVKDANHVIPSEDAIRHADELRSVIMGVPQDTLHIIAKAQAEKYGFDPREMEAAFFKVRGIPTRGGDYQSNHWDQPNVLAHIRLNDRTDADGNKVLFVEEVQSDWGQEGKKKGFAPKNPAPVRVFDRRSGEEVARFNSGSEAEDYISKQDPRMDRLEYEDDNGRNAGVPTAPFVTKTEGWLNLALKRIIKMAVDEGYDKVAFVNGEQSADRYDLSKTIKQIDTAKMVGDYYMVVATGQDGKTVINKAIAKDALPEVLGKDLAEKIVKDGGGTYSGLDLKVGGEGMKTFYDSIVPNATKALLKKLGGGQMEQVSLHNKLDIPSHATRDELHAFQIDDGIWGTNLDYNQFGSKQDAERYLDNGSYISQPGFTITDAMREKASEGMPLFQRKQATGLPEETRLQTAQRILQDKYNRLQLIQDIILDKGGKVDEEQDVYRAEERMHGRVHEQLRDFADTVVKPLIDKAVKYKIDLDELATYAYAKHAAERNAHIQKINQNVQTGSGMSDDEAANIIQLVEHSGDAKHFEELHNDLLAITATTRRVMLDEGLITQQQYDAMEKQYENYVPLRGFEDVDPEKGSIKPGLGRGFNVKGAETIKAMGRDSKAGDIIENIIRDYERATIRSERNAVGKTFLDLVTSNPDKALWEVQPLKSVPTMVNGLVEYVDTLDKGDDTISVKVAGKEVYIKINDPLLLRAMQNTFKAETSDAERFLMKTLGRYTSLLRNTITRYNPAFGIINAVRDSQMGAAGVFDELGAKGVKLYMKNYAAAVMSSGRTEFNKSDPSKNQMDKWMREMRFAGGTTGGVFMRDNATIHKELRDAMLQAGVQPDGVVERIRASKTWAVTTSTLHMLELIGSMSENAARLSAYATAREMGKTPAQAASIAKNLTVNFNRFGEQGQLINTAYLFYNASIQGSVRIMQMMQNKKVRYAAAGMAATGMALAFMAAAVGGDDDDGQPYWDKIADFEKERNLIIMLPPGVDAGAKVGTNGRYIKIPMAYGLNIFPVLGYQLADIIRNAQDRAKGVSVGKAAINMFSATAGAYNPMGGSFDPRDKVQLAMAVSPTIVDAGIQLAAGVDSFGKPLGPQKSPYDKKPDSEVVSAQNYGSASHGIARWLNSVSGGNQARSGAIDIEPGTVKNIQGIALGGLGKFLGDVINLGYLGATDAPIKPRDIPIYKSFYGEYDDKSGMSLFYERSKKAIEEFDDMRDEHKLGIKREYSAEEKFMQKMGAQAKNMSQAFGELKKQEVHIAESDSTSKEKDVKRRMIQMRREKLAEEFNKRWYAEESKLKRANAL